jgi:multidrug efflux pump subunit AcrB
VSGLPRAETNTGQCDVEPFALVIGIVLAYMVLASLFDSLLHPITILPLSIAAPWITFSMIVLLLMGIAKKNSIMLVDYANEVRSREPNMDAAEVMRRAGPVRLRPILMTAMATMMAARDRHG